MAALPRGVLKVSVLLGEAALLPLDVEVVELHLGQADGEVDVGEVPGHGDGKVGLLRSRRGRRGVRVNLTPLSANKKFKN